MNMNIKKTVITGIIIFLSMSCSKKDVEYYYLKGYEYYKQEKYELAIEYYTKAINIDDKNAIVYFARAMAYDKLNAIEQAIADYTSVITICSK